LPLRLERQLPDIGRYVSDLIFLFEVVGHCWLPAVGDAMKIQMCHQEKSKPPRRVGTDVTAYCARKSFDAVKAQQAAL